MALLPLLFGAIAGARRNKEWNPYDPNNREAPYEVPRTGFGRFAMRYGGFDPVRANAAYETDSGMMERGFGHRRSLLADEFANRERLQSAEMAGRQQIQQTAQTHDWNLLQSQLANKALLEQYGAQEAARRQAADITGRQQLNAADAQARRQLIADEYAQRRSERFMTQDPLLQNLREREMYQFGEQERARESQMPRAIGQFGVYDPAQGFLEYQRPTDPGFALDAQGNPQFIPPSAGGLRPYRQSSSPLGTGVMPSPAPVSPQELDQIAPQANGEGVLRKGLGYANEVVNQLTDPLGTLEREFVQPASQGVANAGRGLLSGVDRALGNSKVQIGPVDVAQQYQNIRQPVAALGKVWEVLERALAGRKKEKENQDAAR